MKKSCKALFISFAIIISIILNISVFAKSQGNTDNIKGFLTPNGQIDNVKLNQFRQQRLPEINSNSSQNQKSLLNTAGKFASSMNLDSTKDFLWQSDQWVDSLRHKYFYNINGDVNYSIKQYWEIDQWEYNLNMGYTYDENDRLIERIDQDWNSEYFEYIFRRTIFSYNINGSLADSIRQYWNSHFEQWDDNAKTKYIITYDEFGNQIEFLYQIAQWVDTPPNWAWEDDSKELYSYDGNNNLTECVYQTWDEGMLTWSDFSRCTFGYDGSSNLTDSTTYYWEIDQWAEAMKYTYTYDAHDNQTGEIHQYYEEGVWINTWKFTYDYDGSGNLTGFLEQYWDYNVWENSWKETATYTDGKITENIGEFWNWSINQWITYDKLTYIYDMQGNHIEYTEELWESSQWNNYIKITGHYSEMPTTETGTGSDVEITLDSGIVMLFDSVSTAGSTGVTVADDGPGSTIYDLLPGDSDYIYVTTDAEYIGQVELCFPYDGTLLTAEEEDIMRVYHYTQGEWMDITYSHDKDNDIICGKTASLSPFALGIPKVPLDVDDNGNTILPMKFALDQNYPNPFNPSTIINYSLPRKTNVKIEIYNILGQTVRNLVNEEKAAGDYSIIWDGFDNSGESVSTGMYFYRIETDDFIQTKKMILLK